VSVAQPPLARVGLASGLLVAGLLTTAATLLWKSPLSFLAFVFLGAGLSTAGAALFLWAIIARSVSQRQGS
jgi:hypothetical protein